MKHIKFISRIPTTNTVDKKTIGMWPVNKKEVPFSKLFNGTLPEILSILQTYSLNCCAIQRFNWNCRVEKDSPEYFSSFNGCVFIDIDYDKIKEKPNLSPKEVYQTLFDNLKDQAGFYYIENSLHQNENKEYTNYHIIFQYDCSPYYYELYYKKTFDLVKSILESIGVNTKECLDDNVANPSHLMFLTGKNYKFNEENFKEYKVDYKELELFELKRRKIEEQKKQTKIEPLKESEWSRSFDKITVTKHLNRSSRWYLFCNLAHVLTGDDLKTYWTSIIDEMKPGKHPKKFYIEEPFKCNWLDSIDKVKLDATTLFKYGINIHQCCNHQANREKFIATFGDILSLTKRNLWKQQ